MRAAAAEAGLGTKSRKVYQLRGEILAATAAAAPGINGLAVLAVTL